MSVEAFTWAMNLAPVPMDEGSGRRKEPKPNSPCAFVLVALANHAGPDGKDAFPGVDTIVRYTRLSERTVRTALDRLENEAKVITPSDPDVLAAKIKRADRRPNGYNLDFTKIRTDLTGAEMDKIGRDNPWLRPWIEMHRTSERGATTAPRDIEQVSTGCNDRTNGVQLSPSRGAVVAPEPSNEPSMEPSNNNTPPTPASGGVIEPEPLTLIDAEIPASSGPSFEDFWKVYPRRAGGKAGAEKAWAKAIKSADADKVLAGAARLAADPNLPTGEEVKFIPHPATWLNRGQWEDGPLPPRRKGPGNVHQSGEYGPLHF